MLDEMHVFIAVVALILFSGFLVAFFSHKWND